MSNSLAGLELMLQTKTITEIRREKINNQEKSNNYNDFHFNLFVY